MSRSVQQTIDDLESLASEWEETIAETDLDLTPPDTVEEARYKLQLIKDAKAYMRTLYAAFRIMVDGRMPNNK